MKCPENSHYEVCADNWALTCPGLTDIVPPTQECTEGCECNEGFLFDGEMCIKEKCGCFDNGRSYKVKVNMLDVNTKISLLRFCQLNCILALTRGGGGGFMCTFALIAMPLHCLCSPARWCTKKTVEKNVPASQTKASCVKNIPALRTPNA